MVLSADLSSSPAGEVRGLSAYQPIEALTRALAGQSAQGGAHSVRDMSARIAAPARLTRFGRLTLLAEADPRPGDQHKARRSMVRCTCSRITFGALGKLRSGSTTSCGCRKAGGLSPVRINAVTMHGLSYHPSYGRWRQMIGRCVDPRQRDYHLYGAQGITVCDEWHDVSVFTEYLDTHLGPRPMGYSLDRIDPYGPYTVGNLRWADAVTQRRNQRERTG